MSTGPTGTVTLLFTDIEGSTMRWEQHTEAMQAALARHDALLRDAIETHNGYVFKTVGDAFYAAFATAPDALAAALTAQRTLHAEAWGDLGPLRVRMALHTGAVEARDGDYFGPPLNRVARLLSAAHGEQTLLSGVTQELVRDTLPPGAVLRDLGEHRLKDLYRPEHVFQATIGDLPADFPPLRTLDNRPTNLPIQPTPLIGREREVAAVQARFLEPDVRLLTLIGPGGTGKTRLALQVAAELVDTFADGVFLVELAPISDPDLVASTVAQTLGVRETGGQPILDSLAHFLSDKQILLVLDNMEQVVTAAPLIADLLAAAARTKVLVTSRVALHVYGEHEFLVPPLALPDPKRLPSIERLSQYEAVRLFIQRAQAVKPDFQITNANAPAVAEICVRLDGLPLAIELAAARIKLLPPQAMLTRLESRLKLLTGGARNLPARQQTLRNTIEWSYSLLDTAEQTLFARLAVFIGGRTLEAVETVCNADGDLPIDSFDGMASLLDKSLLRQEDGPDGEPRFVMLETIHEYARERLEASDESEMLRQRHAQYFVSFVEEAEPQLTGPEQGAWLERLEVEHDNVRAALQWALACGEGQVGLRLAGAFWRFWYVRGHLSEGRRWLESVLTQTDLLATSVRAKVLKAAGLVALAQGDYQHATELSETCLTLYQEMHDKRHIAATLLQLGTLAAFMQEYARARSFLEDSIAISRERNDKAGIATALNNLGFDVAFAEGNYPQAALFLEESVALFRELGDRRGLTFSLDSLGRITLQEGDYATAASLFQESLELSRAVGSKINIAYCLDGLAAVAGAQGQAARAARLWGAAEVLHEAIGDTMSPVMHVRYKRDVATARAQLDEAAWQAAWAEGRAMSLEQAVAYALETPEG